MTRNPRYPTPDAYMSACRALHWRTAQLRFHRIEPIQIPFNAPHEPPADFDFAAAEKMEPRHEETKEHR